VTISQLARAAAIVAACAACVASGACAPAVDGPAEHQRALDREDSDRLAAQLAALPGVVRAEVVLRRPVREPLAPPATTAATAAASIVAIIDDRADADAISAAARSLSRALAPDATPTIVVEVGALRPELAKVGPFTVSATSRTPLRALLAAAFALIAALAAALAYTAHRRGNSAQ
jgi:hypothetical protein